MHVKVDIIGLIRFVRAIVIMRMIFILTRLAFIASLTLAVLDLVSVLSVHRSRCDKEKAKGCVMWWHAPSFFSFDGEEPDDAS